MSTTSNLLLAALWFSMAALTPWALLPAAAGLGAAVVELWIGTDDE